MLAKMNVKSNPASEGMPCNTLSSTPRATPTNPRVSTDGPWQGLSMTRGKFWRSREAPSLFDFQPFAPRYVCLF